MRPTWPLLVLTIGQGLAVGLMTAYAVLVLFGRGSPAVLAAALTAAAVGGAGSFFHMHRLAAARYVLRRLSSSWLSREALSTGIFGIAAAGLLVWRIADLAPGLVFALAVVATAVIGWAALYITARLYASIRAMLTWYTPWTVASMAGAAMTGGGLSALALSPTAGRLSRLIVVAVLTVSLVFKMLQWRHFRGEQERAGQGPTAFPFGPVRLEDTGTSKPPYRAQPQVWAGIRPSVRTVLKTAILLGEFAEPGFLLLAGGPSRAALVAAALIWLVGITLDRWLFFADAVHSSRIFFPVDRGARADIG